MDQSAMAGDVVPPLTLVMSHDHKNTGWADFDMSGLYWFIRSYYKYN